MQLCQCRSHVTCVGHWHLSLNPCSPSASHPCPWDGVAACLLPMEASPGLFGGWRWWAAWQAHLSVPLQLCRRTGSHAVAAAHISGSIASWSGCTRSAMLLLSHTFSQMRIAHATLPAHNACRLLLGPGDDICTNTPRTVLACRWPTYIHIHPGAHKTDGNRISSTSV